MPELLITYNKERIAKSMPREPTKKQRRSSWIPSYRYVKSGELSGDLCFICHSFMVMNKTKHKSKGYDGGHGWSVYCQTCGREVEFVSYIANPSAYR